MNSANLPPETSVDRLYLVTGLSGGREVFLGRALGDPCAERLRLEGKVLSMMPPDRMVVRPFPTTVSVSMSEGATSVHHLSDAHVAEEARGLLELTATHVQRSAAPHLFSWMSVAHQAGRQDPPTGGARSETDAALTPRPAAELRDPYLALFEEFLVTTEGFRRALFQCRQVESTHELDRVTELEGDLIIEIGKLANLTATRLNGVLQRERELDRHLEAFLQPVAGRLHEAMGGWPFLSHRLSAARAWARRSGRSELVREVNTLIREGVSALNGILLDHANVLDTLITETLGQYGIVADLERPPLGLAPPARSREITLPAGVGF